MTWFQTIDTQLTVADNRHHLVSRHGLELGTGKQWVFFSLADDTSVGNSSSECGRPRLEVLSRSVTPIWL